MSESKTIAVVSIGKRQIMGEDLPVEHVVKEYFNHKANRLEWILILGLCNENFSASQRFTSEEAALAELEDYGDVKMIKE